MGKDNFTAIALIGERADWSRAERGRGAWRITLGGGAALAPETESEEKQSPPPELAQLAQLSQVGYVLCIDSAATIFRYLELPTVEMSELPAMVELQLDKYLPLPAEEMTIGFEILSQDEVNTRVLGCAVPTEALDATVERLGISSRKAERVDASALATLRLLEEQKIGFAEGREALLVDEGSLLTLLVLDGGTPVLIRSLGPLALPNADVSRTVRLSLLETELERGGKPLERVSVLSARREADALRRFAGEALGCESRLLSPSDLENLSRGAALRTGAPGVLDLTPNAWRMAASDRRFRRVLWQWSAGLTAAWALLAGVLYGGPALLERQAARVSEGVEALQPAAKVVRDVRNRVRMIQMYMERDDSALETLREVSSFLPEGVLLTSYRYQGMDRRAALQGTADSTALAYSLKEHLDASKLFAGSEFTGTVVQNAKTRRYDFEIVILLKASEEEGQ